MKYHLTRNVFRIIVLLAVTGIITLVYLQFHFPKDSIETGQETSGPSKLGQGKKISFVEYHEDKKVYSISIDSFHIERASIGPFAIGPLRIAHLNKVDIELHLEGIESKLNLEKNQNGKKNHQTKEIDFEMPLSSIRDNLPLPFKKIRGVKLKALSLTLWKNTEQVFKITSESASVDPKTKDVIFSGHAVMDGGKKGTVISHRIRWESGDRLFKISDPYLYTKEGERIEGKKMEVDYLFTSIRHLSSK